MKSINLRVAIVEDDSDQRHSIEEFLLDSGYSVWGADSAEAFYRRFMANPVDVVILDIGLPGEDGLAVAALLKGKADVAAIIVSARDSLDDRLMGLSAGADRYLVKPVNLLELAANIDAVASRLALSGTAQHFGESGRQGENLHQGNWHLALQDWVLTSPQGKSVNLTTHQFALLHCLIKAQGQAVTKRDLTDQIFGPRAQNGNERLNLLVTRLRKKVTEVLDEPLPIKTLYQIGYAFTANASLQQNKSES